MADAQADRRALHAYVSDESHEAWMTLSADNGVSVTGIMEAMGNRIAKEIDANGGTAEDVFIEYITPARRIDADRRRRGRVT